MNRNTLESELHGRNEWTSCVFLVFLLFRLQYRLNLIMDCEDEASKLHCCNFFFAMDTRVNCRDAPKHSNHTLQHEIFFTIEPNCNWPLAYLQLAGSVMDRQCTNMHKTELHWEAAMNCIERKKKDEQHELLAGGCCLSSE